jgi:hypothetical protein
VSVGYGDHRSTAPPVTWPTLAEVRAWITNGGGSAADQLVQICLDAAVGRLAERCLRAGTTGEAISPQLKLAAIMQADRWYARKDTPTGVLGSGELGGVVRVAPLDPDVEALIGNDVAYGLA